MPSLNTVLFDTQYLPAVDTEMYVSPEEGGGTLVDKVSATNTDSVTRTVTVRIYPPGESPTGTEFIIVQAKQILAGATYLFPEVVGQLINAGGSLHMEGSAPGVIVARASGREITSA